LLTGVRAGELYGLTWDRVDFVQGSLRIDRSLQRLDGGEWRWLPTKTGKSRRIVPFDPEGKVARILGPTLTGRFTSEWLDLGLVFTTNRGRPIAVDRGTELIRRICSRLGLPVIGPHDLRNTFASLAFVSGVSVPETSVLLGHSTSATTAATYMHILGDARRDAALRVQGFITARPSR
jgi:integrase